MIHFKEGTDRQLNPSARKRGVGGTDSEPDSGLSPRHSKVPQSHKTQQKFQKDAGRSNQKPSQTQRQERSKPSQMAGSSSQQILPKTGMTNQSQQNIT